MNGKKYEEVQLSDEAMRILKELEIVEKPFVKKFAEYMFVLIKDKTINDGYFFGDNLININIQMEMARFTVPQILLEMKILMDSDHEFKKADAEALKKYDQTMQEAAKLLASSALKSEESAKNGYDLSNLADFLGGKKDPKLMN